MKNKVVMVTGASGAIGQAIALRLAEEQACRFALHYHKDQAGIDALAAKLRDRGCDTVTLQADLSDSAQATQMVETATRYFQRDVDILVCSAGIAGQKLFTDLSDREWEQMFAVNVHGVFYCVRAVLPAMIRKQEGKIITVSSIWGMVGASCEVHYSASKAALIGMTKALAKEVGPSHIQVNCVAPGWIDTPMNAVHDSVIRQAWIEETPLQTIGTPEDVAAAVSFLVSSDSDFMTGQVLSPNGGIVI